MSEIFATILLPLAFDRKLSYRADFRLNVGDVVKVELGKKKIWGVVTQVSSEKPAQIEAKKIKPVLEKHPLIKIDQNHLKFIFELSSYNLANQGLVLRSFMGILKSDKVKKLPKAATQKIDAAKFSLKKLSPKQEEIFVELQKLFHKEKSATALVEGVTGSGKTEIYFALIAKILQENNHSQILILLPEIALTSQLLMRFEEQYGFKAALWHSKISKKEKREVFYGLVSGSIRILIGARSALLLPFANLRLIIVDEEHDESFKQEDVFNFNARDMAILLSKLQNFPVILSSATPSLESFYNANIGKYHHFQLSEKFSQSRNQIDLIDLRQEKLNHNSFLSSRLKQAIASNLQQNKQTLLFLNRRGYSPVSMCKECGKKYECQNCDFNLVFHKAKNKLICHHCGSEELASKQCKFCLSENSLINLGVGVEKLLEEVQENFLQARILLVNSDEVKGFGDAETIVKKILHNEVDIIIGTQMIAKGYDFPNLSLVGVVDVDSMLYSSELRASEKIYQLLTQVIGRAGRRQEQGKVLIQTYDPQNLIFEKIIKDDKKDFYNFEIKNRQMLDLPPFSRMIKFEVSAFLESEAKNFAKKLIRHFPANDKIELFGPAPAVIQKLKNRHHFLVNLKAKKQINLQKLTTNVLQSIEIPSSIRLRIDVDPV